MEFALNPYPEEIFTTIDVLWFFFSVVTTILLGVITWQAKRVVDKMDAIEKAHTHLMVEHTVTDQKLQDHIENEGIHCNFQRCVKNHETT